MHQIAEFISILACALFTGASVYVNLVEHPARMQCGVEIAATEFPPSYRRAAVMQATCAAVGLVSSFAAWLAGASFWWLIAGVLLGSVIPFTLIAILPTNKRLLSPTLDRRSAEAERLLARWNALHAVRSVLSGLALLLFLFLLVFKPLCPPPCYRTLTSRTIVFPALESSISAKRALRRIASFRARS